MSANPNIEHLAATVQEKFGTNDASQQALHSFRAESCKLLGESNPQIFGAQSLNANFKQMVDQVCGPFAVIDGTPEHQQAKDTKTKA